LNMIIFMIWNTPLSSTIRINSISTRFDSFKKQTLTVPCRHCIPLYTIYSVLCPRVRPWTSGTTTTPELHESPLNCVPRDWIAATRAAIRAKPTIEHCFSRLQDWTKPFRRYPYHPHRSRDVDVYYSTCADTVSITWVVVEITIPLP